MKSNFEVAQELKSKINDIIKKTDDFSAKLNNTNIEGQAEFLTQVRVEISDLVTEINNINNEIKNNKEIFNKIDEGFQELDEKSKVHIGAGGVW